jgi:hypothetical protein
MCILIVKCAVFNVMVFDTKADMITYYTHAFTHTPCTKEIHFFKNIQYVETYWMETNVVTSNNVSIHK